MNWYNEHDSKKAAWLRELIRRNVIAPGVVDERSVTDVRPYELAGFRQCHFFAGIGIWSYALRLAGVPDDEPVWTGSCPCQPVSQAGKRKGAADVRHLWPAWFRLIAVRNPERIFGEQVSSRGGLAWLDSVRSDLEAANYKTGAIDLCGACIGAPHIRQRLYFVGVAASERLSVRGGTVPERQTCGQYQRSGNVGGVGDTDKERLLFAAFGRADCVDAGSRAWNAGFERYGEPCGPVNGYWRNADWVWCRDQKYRPVESGTFPLVNGAPARILRVRGYGDGIIAPLAAAFIQAAMSI